MVSSRLAPPPFTDITEWFDEDVNVIEMVCYGLHAPQNTRMENKFYYSSYY